jgi:hypothetical protein
MRYQKLWMTLGALALVFVLAPASHAQALNSNVAQVQLNAVLGEAITVAAGPGTVNFALVPNGVANGDAPVSVTTTWSLAASRTTIGLYAYFSTPSALTDGSGNNIPAANVSGSVDSGPSGTFTGATPFTNNGITVFSQSVVGAFNSNRTDTIDLSIDTSGLGLPSQSPNRQTGWLLNRVLGTRNSSHSQETSSKQESGHACTGELQARASFGQMCDSGCSSSAG